MGEIWKLRSPNFLSGIVVISGKDYEIKMSPDRKFGYVEVDNLDAAMFLQQHKGYAMMGRQAMKGAHKILVERGRGVGDILMVIPVLRLLRRDDPEKDITFACDEHMMDILKGCPYVNRVVPLYRVRTRGDKRVLISKDGDQFEEFDATLNLEMIVENDPDRAKYHRIDLFAKQAGFDLPLAAADRRLEMPLFAEDREAAVKLLKENGWHEGEKFMSMSLRTTADNRNMPAHKFREIADRAVQEGWKVALLDHDANFGWEADGIINLTGKTNHREAASIIKLSTIYFGPDSGNWHLANAVEAPNVVYFGAMNWRLRVSGPTRVLFKNVPCYPCDAYHCHWRIQKACIDLPTDKIWNEIKEHLAAVKQTSRIDTIPPPANVMEAFTAVGVGG